MNSWEKNSISPEFHPATKPLTVEPVDSGNEIGAEQQPRSAHGRAVNKHRHAKRAGVIFSIDWVAWGRTGCQSC